jgi:hypothetical protein
MISVQGAAKLEARLHALKDSPHGILKHWQIATVAEAKHHVPRKTGHLGRSIEAGEIGPSHAVVRARVNYAGFVEYGTRAHEIRPRNKRVLRFAANKGSARLTGSVRRGGDAAFARSVHHPGTRPQPFLIPGARAALSRVSVSAVIDAWNKAA